MARNIAIVVVMIIINAFMIYAILNAWKRVRDKLEVYFVAETSNFPLDLKKEEKETKVVIEEKQIVKNNNVYIVKQNDDNSSYVDKQFKQQYKEVKESMAFSKPEMVEEVVELIENENIADPGVASGIKSKYSFDVIYELSTLSSEQQLDVLRESFNLVERRFLDEYVFGNESAFNCIDFFNYVSQQAIIEDPNIYVKTGWKTDNFDDINDKVVTMHDKEIIEGVKIIHKDKMYDYSI